MIKAVFLVIAPLHRRALTRAKEAVRWGKKNAMQIIEMKEKNRRSDRQALLLLLLSLTIRLLAQIVSVAENHVEG